MASFTFERRFLGSISTLLSRASAATLAAAAVVQGKLDELTAAGASEEALTALRSLIGEILGFENPTTADAQLKTRAAIQ